MPSGQNEDSVTHKMTEQQPLADSLGISDEALAEISLILEAQRCFRLNIYKSKCMKRRIAIRMRSCHCHDAASYCRLLRESDVELDLLLKTLTIHVSQFFRNPSMFEKLRTLILPSLFRMADAGQRQLRFASFGCAGGEEPYSLAIILQEYFPQQLMETPVEINAYDIDTDILQTAHRGEYSEDRLKDLPDSSRELFFVSHGPHMQLSAEIRKMVTFYRHNILDAATYAPCELALCRNTLIYFARPEQEKILCGIAHILPLDGILILGKSETLVGEARQFFATVCPIERIYRRI
ncbi:MAG: protein-glutamate O-methyltransferase CheR [Desulfuromonadaceae bacterium]|nr:protein-glutamate O-methyltransferase CheR [Desulfuromonadaceae bacterium]